MSTYRLPSDLQDDLTWYWTQADADMGVCSGGDIEHRAPPVEREDGVRMHIVTPRRRSRRERSNERRKRVEDEIYRMWNTQTCHGDRHVVSIEDPVLPDHGPERPGFPRTPMPQWARRIVSNDRKRAVRVHATISRMVRLPSGPEFERVLYRVYGPCVRHPVCYGRIGSELAPLVEYTETVSRRMVPGTSHREVGERALSKGASELVVMQIRQQANALLERASRVYLECAAAEKAERARERAARFRSIFGACA